MPQIALDLGTHGMSKIVSLPLMCWDPSRGFCLHLQRHPCMNSGNITYCIHAFLQSYIIFSAQKLLWKRFQILKSRLHPQISVAYGSVSRREVTPRMTMSPSSRWTDITTWGETPTYHSQRIYPTKLVLSWWLLRDSSFQRPGFWDFDAAFLFYQLSSPVPLSWDPEPCLQLKFIHQIP